MAKQNKIMKYVMNGGAVGFGLIGGRLLMTQVISQMPQVAQFSDFISIGKVGLGAVLMGMRGRTWTFFGAGLAGSGFVDLFEKWLFSGNGVGYIPYGTGDTHLVGAGRGPGSFHNQNGQAKRKQSPRQGQTVTD